MSDHDVNKAECAGDHEKEYYEATKVFFCQAWDEIQSYFFISEVAVAENKSEVLQMLTEKYPDTHLREWFVAEVNTSIVGLHARG